MLSILQLVDTVLWLYSVVLIVQVVLSWLVSFNVVNTGNAFVSTVGRMTWNLTEPVLRPIRRVLPQLGGLDLSPIVLLLLIWFLRSLLWEYGPGLLGVGPGR